MTGITKLVSNFVKENDLSQIKETLFSMSIRDCKEHPELWNNSNLEEEVTELFSFLEHLSKIEIES